MGYRYGHHIDMVILDIDVGYGISIWEMTVSILPGRTYCGGAPVEREAQHCSDEGGGGGVGQVPAAQQLRQKPQGVAVAAHHRFHKPSAAAAAAAAAAAVDDRPHPGAYTRPLFSST
jgi:hypothetical protein